MIEIIQNKKQVKEIMYRGGIYMEETRKIPIREVGTKDKEYPEKLCQYTGMPDKLYVRGTFPDPENRQQRLSVRGQLLLMGAYRHFGMRNT